MHSTDLLAEKIRDFVYQQFPLARQRGLAEDDPLLENGIIDSLGVLQIVEFIESELGIMFSDEDMVSEVFESIRSLANFVATRLPDSGAGAGV